ncbi:DUF4239 domain-containing protein [Pararhizobium antarcticum]|uniref:DUF4239 domain-containing protein n=1 Tax=Pararhizobium antarcticum TaxID=1798805 RepID=A0A657LSP5_9HYPH|nr:DUF4239 domain-containing protein [Pararhizobium antarcticum]OJF92003.1 hypothetical protein AX761_05830 [Rhizobium sp. 58]OJF96045.1 hypothetical protein AX760_18490 [Pararhizobium antarcticum]
MPGFVISIIMGLLFATGALAIVFSSYALSRKLLGPGAEGDRTHEAASTIAVRIAALHGLILALVYAQELNDYQDIRKNLMEESVAIADVYNDAKRFGGVRVVPVQEGLARYLVLVVGEEWTMLGHRQGLSSKAWAEWDGVYERLLDLTPATDRERYLVERMRNRVTEIARFRQIREQTAIGGFSGLFWAPALIGLALLAIPFYVYRPTRTHIFLLSIFGAYSGVILFFIFAFSNPFEQPGKLEPRPFQKLLEGDIGQSLPAAQQQTQPAS